MGFGLLDSKRGLRILESKSSPGGVKDLWPSLLIAGYMHEIFRFLNHGIQSINHGIDRPQKPQNH